MASADGSGEFSSRIYSLMAALAAAADGAFTEIFPNPSVRSQKTPITLLPCVRPHWSHKETSLLACGIADLKYQSVNCAI